MGEVNKILVTGAEGFIGRNLVLKLSEMKGKEVTTFCRGDDISNLKEALLGVEAVIHLAGENRPSDEKMFEKNNVNFTRTLCTVIKEIFETTKIHIPIVFTSTIHTSSDTHYGRSKLAAENVLRSLAREIGNPCTIFRLPGVFGKWCKPNYNSVVATFCHNIARGLPIEIKEAQSTLRLVYIDDVVSALLRSLDKREDVIADAKIEPEYLTTVGDLAVQIRAFAACRNNLVVERVGAGFTRALYATYVSYLPVDKLSYEVTKHSDARGVFVEMLKTSDSGQFSYFTALPGVTRGGHYHHTKTEKFLVIKGRAHFRFRNLLTKELVELQTDGCHPQVVDTVPGWTHDITNVGDEEMIVMLWANENFDPDKPDTVAGEI